MEATGSNSRKLLKKVVEVTLAKDNDSENIENKNNIENIERSR